MTRSIKLAIALSAAWLAAGCVAELNSCATWVEQTYVSNRAWRDRKWMYEGIDSESSFKAGFKAGYRFANCGGDVCQPPGPSHFWFTNGMTEQDQRDAQAWCDGFTHGSLAAQQDGNTTASALDAQTAQPPQGVPDVLYYSGGGHLGQSGGPQYAGQVAPGQFASGQFTGEQCTACQFGSPQMANGMTPVPDAISPGSSMPPTWSTASAPADAAYRPPAPPAEGTELQPASGNTHYQGSAAFPGIGSLRTAVGPDWSTVPHAGEAPQSPSVVAPAPPSPASTAAAVNSLRIVPNSNGPQPAAPSGSSPTSTVAPAGQWELPTIRD
jgi:hypothetical protein